MQLIMAPTTLSGQVTETCPNGRNTELEGHPIRMTEIIATLEGSYYVERVSVNNISNITKAKKALKKAFANALNNKGFSFIEVLSICPTNWGLTPKDSLKWLEDNMIPYYPLGVKKDLSKEES